jgi:hypothetical protein
MRRVAIILGSPFPQNSEGHLRGVSGDVENYKKFLLSSDGGAWREDEIYTGIHIGKSTIPKIQRLCKDADIAYVIYSGHGFMRSGANYLNINSHESLNLSHLYTSAKRQITIIDACRTNYPYEHFEGIAGFRINFDNTRPDIARASYDSCIQNMPWGKYTMFSCSANESSQDTSDGGRFTVSLLRNISKWSANTDEFYLSAYDALNMTHEKLLQGSGEQAPSHEYTTESVLDFPISVSTRAFLQSRGIEYLYKSVPQQRMRASNNKFGKVLAAATVGLIILSSLKG